MVRRAAWPAASFINALPGIHNHYLAAGLDTSLEKGGAGLGGLRYEEARGYKVEHNPSEV